MHRGRAGSVRNARCATVARSAAALSMVIVAIELLSCVPGAWAWSPTQSLGTIDRPTVQNFASTTNPTGAWAVAQTLVLPNNTLVSGNYPAQNGVGPYSDVYDSGKGEVFVTNSNGLSVISDVTNQVVATVAVVAGSFGIAYDGKKGEVYVASGNSVSVISDTTNKVVATVGVGLDPRGLAYDRPKGEVFVTNYGSKNVSVIDDKTNTVVATVVVGANPDAVAYQTGQGRGLCNKLRPIHKPPRERDFGYDQQGRGEGYCGQVSSWARVRPREG